MIEVDNLRRSYNFGQYDQSYAMGGHNPFPGALGTTPMPEGHRVLIHWNKPELTRQPATTDTTKSGSRSDADEDDEDEDRPFTPPPPRERLSYTRYQLELLNGIYIEVRYPNSTQKQLIAKRVGITREQVKIWFQNRRRKDVVGNSGKGKSCDTSTSSSGSQDSERQQSPRTDEAESSTSDDNMSIKQDSPESPKDAEESVVPTLVMKSIIGELQKFINDPLKGRKNKKKVKAKQKQKEKEKLRKGLAATLLTGSYDMISPPNQIVPQAFFEQMKRGFNHSKNSSAFANPRGNKGSPHISNMSVVPTPDNSPTDITPRDISNVNKHSPVTFGGTTMFPYSTQPGQPPMFSSPSYFQPQGGVTGSEIPVLSDLLGYRSPHDVNRKKTPPSSSLHVPMTTQIPPRLSGSSSDRDKGYPLMNSFNTGRPLNGIFPYSFLAEQPVFMSSLRQPDHILRPSPHYPSAHFSEDPYQPLMISSFNNPYFMPTTTSWATPGVQSPPTSIYAPGI